MCSRSRGCTDNSGSNVLIRLVPHKMGKSRSNVFQAAALVSTWGRSVPEATATSFGSSSARHVEESSARRSVTWCDWRLILLVLSTSVWVTPSSILMRVSHSNGLRNLRLRLENNETDLLPAVLNAESRGCTAGMLLASETIAPGGLLRKALQEVVPDYFLSRIIERALYLEPPIYWCLQFSAYRSTSCRNCFC